MYTFMYIPLCVYIYHTVHLGTHTLTHKHALTCTCTRKHAHTRTQTHTHIHLHTHTHTRTHTHTHKHKYTHTHTHTHYTSPDELLKLQPGMTNPRNGKSSVYIGSSSAYIYIRIHT